MTIGKRIKTLRKALNYSQEEFGKILGLSRSAICGIENETRNIPDRTIKLIANIFDVSEEWLKANEQEREEIIKKYDSKVDNEKLVNEVNTFEMVQNTFGEQHVTILNYFEELNSKGRQKSIEFVSDLTLIPKYKKESPNDDSQNTK